MSEGERKKSLVLKVLLGFLAVFVVLGVVTAVAIFRWSQSPQVQEKLGAAKDVLSMTMKASKAEGTEALRALGCREAAIFDAEQADKYLGSIGQLTADRPEKLEVPLVFCGVLPDRNLTCDRVAATYGVASPAAGEAALVMVQSQGFTQKTLCAGVYAKDGSLVEAIAPEAMR